MQCWLKASSYKATIGSDRIDLRWLDRHLSGKALDTIIRALVSASRTRGSPRV
jgi:hypothetical protein